MAKDAGVLSVGAKQKAKNRATPTYAKAADLCATVRKGGKAQGTIVDYTGCLRRADEWLPGQLALLRRDRDIVVDEIAKSVALPMCPSHLVFQTSLKMLRGVSASQ